MAFSDRRFDPIWVRNVKESVKNHDMSAIDTFRQEIMAAPPTRTTSNMLNLLLSACEKGEDLPIAKKIVQDLASINVPISESAAVALIRCYSDLNQFQEAWKLVQTLQRQKSLRIRTLQPLFELLFRDKNIHKLFELFEYCTKVSLHPGGNQVALLLRLYLEVMHQQNASLNSKLVSLLAYTKESLLGLDFKDLLYVCATANQQTVRDVLDEGILTHSRTDVLGEVIEDHGGGLVRVLSPTYPESTAPLATFDISFRIDRTDRYRPVGTRIDPVAFIPEKFVVLSERNGIGRNKRIQSIKQRLPRGRMVHISPTTCECPNCKATVTNVQLSATERSAVRNAISSISSERTNVLERLDEFTHFLEQHEPFDYILDGANMAYHNQNFAGGKFSYKQIEMVAKHVEAMGKRPLVILPQCYIPKDGRIVPNNVNLAKGSRLQGQISEDDKVIIDRWTSQNMIYPVRVGSDDWYWIFASVFDHPSFRNKDASTPRRPTLVITNDLMRDHYLSILTPRAFLRWRASQVVYYSFNYANETNTPPKHDQPKELQSVTFYPPGKYSREIQYSKKTQRWHFPANDRNSWLCLSLNDTIKSNRVYRPMRVSTSGSSSSSPSPIANRMKKKSWGSAKRNQTLSKSTKRGTP